MERKHVILCANNGMNIALGGVCVCVGGGGGRPSVQTCINSLFYENTECLRRVRLAWAESGYTHGFCSERSKGQRLQDSGDPSMHNSSIREESFDINYKKPLQLKVFRKKGEEEKDRNTTRGQNSSRRSAASISRTRLPLGLL